MELVKWLIEIPLAANRISAGSIRESFKEGSETLRTTDLGQDRTDVAHQRADIDSL